MKHIYADDWQILKDDANKIISKIDVRNLNNDDYVMLGACVAILDHPAPVVESHAEPPETPAQAAPAVPQSKSYADIVRSEIADCECFTDMGEMDIARQVCEIAKYFLSKLKQQATTSEDKALVRELWAHLNLAKGRLQ